MLYAAHRLIPLLHLSLHYYIVFVAFLICFRKGILFLRNCQINRYFDQLLITISILLMHFPVVKTNAHGLNTLINTRKIYSSLHTLMFIIIKFNGFPQGCLIFSKFCWNWLPLWKQQKKNIFANRCLAVAIIKYFYFNYLQNSPRDRWAYNRTLGPLLGEHNT